MPEFERSLHINAAADEVFQYVADLNNLPNYLPTVHHTESAGSDRIRMTGEAAGHPYDDTGFFRPDPAQKRMEWGSDSESSYAGWLEVTEADDHKSCDVTVHLSFDAHNHALQEMDKQGGREQAVNHGIENALHSLKNQCEGRGGKIEARRA